MTLSTVYVGAAMSGRRTSLAAVLRASGSEGNPLTIDPHVGHEVTVGPRRMLARISSIRSSLNYENATDPRVEHRVRSEVDWLSEADGIVFVVDPQTARAAANEEEFAKLKRDLS